MTTNQLAVYLGDPVRDPGESRVIAELRAALGTLPSARLLVANFIAAGRQQRQIDLLVLATRLCHVELKVVDPALPIIGDVNGPWRQRPPNGTDRELGSNAFRQAHDGTYAISDVMRRLAADGAVPSVPRFVTTIDTVVCLFPRIPEGSQLAHYRHVEVVDFPQLLARIADAGPEPPWDESHWHSFLRRLGVVRDDARSSRDHRAREHMLTEHRRRFAIDTSRDLHELVPVATTCPVDIVQHVRDGGTCVFLGDHGLGKTHTARHTAVALAQSGHVAIWIRADEYEKGKFRSLLARAIAPFSAEHINDFLAAIQATATPVTLIVDGYNECPPGLRNELLEQLSAFRLRHPGGTIITSTVPVTTPAALPAVTARFELPSGPEREALLRSHGARQPARVSDTFTTPYELAVVASCDDTLPDSGTATDLFDAYIRRLAPTETVRAGLRALAAAMDEQLRTSLPIIDARNLLAGAATLGLSAQVVDTVLASPLLSLSQGRGRFRHELLGRVLAAEQLVLAAPTGGDLSRQLATPAHADLRCHALVIERDPLRRGEALSVLADAGLYEAAARGDLGDEAQQQVSAAISGALHEACAATQPECATIAPAPHGGWEWTMTRRWTAPELAMFTAAGRLVAAGQFLDEVGALLDRTDGLCDAAMRQVADAGEHAPITAVVAATYTQSARRDTHALPASVVAVSCDLAAMHHRRPVPSGAAARLVGPIDAPSWGRLFVALTVLDATDGRDASVLPRLLRAAWDAGGYHLRLQALETVQHSTAALDDAAGTLVADLLETFTTNHLFLSSALIEALAGYGRVEPIATLDHLAHELTELLLTPDDPEAWHRAAGFVANQFEDETIVGPYTAAIETLPPADQTRLLIMAARSRHGFWRSWTLARLVEAAPTGDTGLDRDLLDLFLGEATTVDTDGPMLQDNVAAHVEGLRGWARMATSPPPWQELPGDSYDQRAWRGVGQLILAEEGLADVDRRIVWTALGGELRDAAVDALYRIRWGYASADTSGVWKAVLRSSQTEICSLFEHALVHRESLSSLFANLRDADARDRFVIDTLGAVGTHSTAKFLECYASDPLLGPSAVAAIRRIHDRTT